MQGVVFLKWNTVYNPVFLLSSTVGVTMMNDVRLSWEDITAVRDSESQVVFANGNSFTASGLMLRWRIAHDFLVKPIYGTVCLILLGLPHTHTYHQCDFIFLNKKISKYKLLARSFIMISKSSAFISRVVNILNSLPNTVVDVESVNLFKSRLDRFWMHQIDYGTEFTGTGNQSGSLNESEF